MQKSRRKKKKTGEVGGEGRKFILYSMLKGIGLRNYHLYQ